MPIGSILGRAVPRKEDPRFLAGQARYVENLPGEDALHAVFVRSPAAHARVVSIDASEASAMPGVEAVFTAANLELPPKPTESSVPDLFARPPIASEVVRYVGEPVAVVLAATRAQAADAAEAVFVDYDTLPVVVDPLRALEPGAPLLFPEAGTNVARETTYPSGSPWEDGAPVADDAVIVRVRFVNQRVAPVPMEVNGGLAVPGEDGRSVTLWMPSQAPFWARDELAKALGMEQERIRVIAPDVGGGFGAKGESYPEHVVVCALALRLGRPVRYVETRSENLTTMVHGRAQVQDVELRASRDGRILGLRVDIVADMGAYPTATFLPELTRRMASGVYRIPSIEVRARSVLTNTTPVSAYRGAGRPEAAALLERAVDMLAAELGMDPVEVRRRNFIPPEAFPYETAASAMYDTGEYAAALEEALRVAGYERLRIEQAERRRRGDVRQLGIGLSVYVEITGWGPEFGSVEVHEDGTATVLTGTSPHGQGHETAWAQIVAGTLGVPMHAIHVVHSDTGVIPRGEGTGGSRSLQLGGSAVRRAGEAVLEKARAVAAHVLEASVEDIVLIEPEASEDADGSDGARMGVAGVPDRSLSWTDLARAAADSARLPDAMEPGLKAAADFDMGTRNTFPFGAHVAVVEVDTETGDARLVRHVAVDDCGWVLNPLLVEGQVHGGIAQGVAQALYEQVVFDEDGNPLTANLMSYAMPTAADLPGFERSSTVTPTTLNPLGAKGIGEAATVGSTPAVQNAVIDALAHLGVHHLDMPLSPERVWRAIREAKG